MMLHSLLPVKLKQSVSSYQTVQELAEVLEHAIKDKDIRNVALTGPFGAGKSSILQTLMEDYKTFEYLPISLATLQADEDIDNTINERTDEKEKKIENLNRKIEYSILQQLIYREKAETVPNSRFRRIVHIEESKLRKYSLCSVLFFISFLIVFEPSYAKVDTIYDALNFGRYNLIADVSATLYMLWALCRVLIYIIKSYSNSKLNKLNLKDAEIEIVENNSIFNKHLDEILYFFQVTSYNVVIIEDLDRFGTANIFLKLRELNQLINESKIVGRHVVFVYAVKDDVFKDEARTKFFDYITTVIPVINPSNSKAKLKAALKERGFEEGEIADDDLAEMAFFIQDMRILTNIANEYYQYRQKLYDNGKKNLSLTKLLAMIVYKNYFPKDFAQLHRREGLVYQCINSKPRFVTEALSSLEKRKNELDEKKKVRENNCHIQERELRLLFMEEVREAVHLKLASILIDHNYLSIRQIADNEKNFNALLSQEVTHYKYYYGYGNNTNDDNTSIDFKKIKEKLSYNERIAALKATEKDIQDEERQIERERILIQSLKLNALIAKYDIGESAWYQEIRLSPLMDVFIRRGYIDEEYYDYISYFYAGMVSLADRDLLLSIKRQMKQEYTYHIDKIDNFVKELKPYMFEHDAILNIELLDYLARKNNAKGREMFTQLMGRLERDNAPIDFLVQYYLFGKRQERVFNEFIGWDRDLSWAMIEGHADEEERAILREAWLKFCGETTIIQNEWLNDNYSFLTSRVESIGIQRCKELVEANSIDFKQLNTDNSELLLQVIDSWRYEINVHNLCLIATFLNKEQQTTPSNLNLTRITNANNDSFEEYIKDSIVKAFSCFSQSCKDESAENIRYILNNEKIASGQKASYLNGQQAWLDNFDGVNDGVWDIAMASFVIQPMWENIDTFYRAKKSITQELIGYIEHYYIELEDECSDKIGTKQELFEGLLGTGKLSLKAYESISKAFDYTFDGYEELTSLSKEQLTILLKNGMISFSVDNTSIMQPTPIYTDYLTYHSSEFVKNLDDSYNLSADNALALLQSDKFSISEKREIVSIIDNRILLNSQPLADIVIEILLVSNNIAIGQNVLNGLLQIAGTGKHKVLLVTQMLSAYQYDMDSIAMILSLLGGKYQEIAERKKRPVIENNEWNIALLSKLKAMDFISSTSLEDDGIRVIPKRVL